MNDIIKETKHILASINPAKINEFPRSVQRLIDVLVPGLLELVDSQNSQGLHAAHARLRNEIRGIYAGSDHQIQHGEPR